MYDSAMCAWWKEKNQKRIMHHGEQQWYFCNNVCDLINGTSRNIGRIKKLKEVIKSNSLSRKSWKSDSYFKIIFRSMVQNIMKSSDKTDVYFLYYRTQRVKETEKLRKNPPSGPTSYFWFDFYSAMAMTILSIYYL